MSNTLKQGRRILEIVDEQDPCRDQLQTLIDGGHLVHLVRAAKANRLPLLDAFIAFLESGVAPAATAVASAPVADSLSEIFRLTVDARAHEEMIAAGAYDWANSDITPKRFPITADQTGQWEARYFHFDVDIESLDAKTRIEGEDQTNPWQVAQIGHLLAHGAKNPEEQRKLPIIALGSVAGVRGDRGVPYLDGLRAHRELDLDRWSGRWLRGCRFLAVRRVSAPQVSEDAAAA